MKNKNITYLLGVTVLVIWGIVFYRIFNGLSTDNTIISAPVREVVEFSDEIILDSFTLIANYRDPFLGAWGHTRNNVERPVNYATTKVSKVKKEEPVVKEPEIPMDWSFISYDGIVKNPKTNKNVILLSVNGRQYMASENETVDGVTIIKYFTDSIKVSYQGKTHSIRR
ncbi:MAG TPA: hypothetical protein VIK89_15845 [Cytophagaceae bacterium]